MLAVAGLRSGPGASPRPQSPPLVRRRPHHRLAEPEQRGIWPDAGRRSPAAGAAAGYRAGPGGLPQASGPVLQAGDRHFALRQPRLPPLPSGPARPADGALLHRGPGLASTPTAWWGWWAAAIRTSTACGPPSELGRQLARQGAVIVSGLATGLDGACHQAAVDEKRPPPSGSRVVPIDKPYPKSTIELRRAAIEHGCVVGEYAPGEDGVGKNGFLLRNRLIAGLSRVLVVVQGRGKERHHVHGGTRRAVRPEDLRRARRDGPDALPRLQPPDRPGPRRTGDGRRRHPPPDERGEACAPGPEARARPAQSRPGRRLPPGRWSGPCWTAWSAVRASVEELSACCRAGTASCRPC